MSSSDAGPPPRPRDPVDVELPTLELELQQLKAKVADVEKRIAWLERGVQAWARGREWRGEDSDAQHR